MKMLLTPTTHGVTQLRVRERVRKYGAITAEEYISKREDVLIVGANASGKTRWLRKIAVKSPELWPKHEVFFLRGQEPIARWLDDPRLAAQAAADGKDFSKYKAHQKTDALRDYIQKKKCVLILDDAHKIQARKLDVVVELVRSARLVVTGAHSEQSIGMSLRMALFQRAPQTITLKSDAAYDITSIALWLALLVCLAMGYWQLAAVLGSMKFLGGGRNAAKQT